MDSLKMGKTGREEQGFDYIYAELKIRTGSYTPQSYRDCIPACAIPDSISQYKQQHSMERPFAYA